MPGPGGAFIGALVATGYMMPFVKAVEVLAGLLLLANRFVPLALVALTPIVLNIVAFHVFLAPDGMVMAIVLLAFQGYLGWSYRRAFHPMLAAKTSYSA
jgi:hypothetical protein